jgi:hypothetical protein
MTVPSKNSKILIAAGVVSLMIGVSVFAVRFHHEGAYAMPHGGPLYGALGALLVGGILLWSGKPLVVGWIALVLSPAALFPAIYGIVGELEEVVSLYAVDADGKTTDLRLWIVDRDDGAWVGMSRDKATEFSLNGARLEMLRAGEVQCVVPILSEEQQTTNEIHAMKVDKYAAARGAAALGMYPLEATPNTAALRLDPGL